MSYFARTNSVRRALAIIPGNPPAGLVAVRSDQAGAAEIEEVGLALFEQILEGIPVTSFRKRSLLVGNRHHLQPRRVDVLVLLCGEFVLPAERGDNETMLGCHLSASLLERAANDRPVPGWAAVCDVERAECETTAETFPKAAPA